MGAAHQYIHITPQLLDQHITLTHDCHDASHFIIVLLMHPSLAWTRTMDDEPRFASGKIIYIYCRALLPYIYYLSRYDAHHTDHINRAD